MRPLTPKEIVAALDKWHVRYVLVPGWETRDNGSHWSDKKSVTGLMSHHTAGDAQDSAELNVLTNGRTGLRGPLCNFGVGDDAIVDVIAAGSANHAGKGDPKTLALVQQEKTPLDREVKPTMSSSNSASVGGNSRFYGWEVYYGIRNDPTMNAQQHRALILSQVAILDALDTLDKANVWTAKAVIGHREWTTAKIDPSGVKMHEERQLINKIRAAGPARAKVWFDTGTLPATAPTTPPIPVVTNPKDVSMVLIRVRDTDPVYVSNHIERRWVQSSAHLTAIRRAQANAGGSGVVTIIEASELDAFGPLVGKEPPA